MNDYFVEIPYDRISGAVSSSNVYSEQEKLYTTEQNINNQKYTVVNYGSDNQLPYKLDKLVEKNSVMLQNKYFNLITCYGRGLEYMDLKTIGDEKPKPTQDKEIRKWIIRNNLKKFFAEQIVDMKYYAFSVAVVILSRDRQRIVKLVHKDACHIRFELPDDMGKIGHVFFADWEDNNSPDNIEVIPVLDEDDPIGDLFARTGKEKDELGIFGPDKKSNRKYAIVSRIPVPNCRLYPTPYWTGCFRDGWYDIYSLLTATKRAKIKNGQSIRYHLEINQDFWMTRARSLGISKDTKEFSQMKKEFLEGIKDCLSGNSNSDKLVWSEFQALVDGKEKHNLKINVIDTSKAGNEYNDDIAEASNVLCYDDNIHPNLAGASPGKSQMNNSGSDKRELFTMKQSLETMTHDMLMNVHNCVIAFNEWEDKVYPDVPLILLTTLDKNTDAKEISMSNEKQTNDQKE
ncbi:MAG: hypothetical protein LKE54_03700 [Prevotella sp.]|jgi:hypothetical protein|nr:hypothetical protein [Prevotella sp.]MCH3994151.1 hypothetical protein [Prevotella sp.]